MFQPDLEEILEKVDCRYTLIVEIAKRARQLVGGAEPLIEPVAPMLRHLQFPMCNG